MSAVVWVNILLTLPFLIAFIGLPLWLTFHRRHAEWEAAASQRWNEMTSARHA